MPTPPSVAGRGEGFTLVETLVASCILAGALLASAGLLGRGLELAAEARRASTALALARAIAERVQAGGVRTVAQSFAELGCDPDRSSCRAVDALPEALPGGRSEVRLEALDGERLARTLALRAEIEVSWSAGRRRRASRLVVVRR